MIRLRDILNENEMPRSRVLSIVDKVYPFIVKKYGKGPRGIPQVELYNNMYARLSGEPEMQGEDDAHGEYDWEENKIYLYYPMMTDIEQILRSLIHEYIHSLQDEKEKQKNREQGYDNDPFEKEASAAEEDWQEFAKEI